jgi:HemY protein
MIRLLVFLCFLALAAFGLGWFLDRPGNIVLTWQDYRIETSAGVGLGAVLAIAIALSVLWAVIRTIFRLPSVIAFAARQRKRTKGYAALSRGMIAAGAGDVRLARKSATDAAKHLPDEPLALLLKAQAAQLAGDRAATDAAFTEMVERPATKLLGYRGLHIEAQRRGDLEAAHYFAQEAHKIAPLAWSGKAVLDHRAAQGDWRQALAVLENNIAAKLIDKKTGERQKAVLETALAIEAEGKSPDEALRLSRLAAGRDPSLVPAVALAARLMSRKGDIRKAAKLIEAAWTKSPHPDLTDVYLDLRPGDSNADRLVRANMLMRLTPREPESRMAVARAALAARDFQVARNAMKPLIAEGEDPSVRMCLIMADLEEAEHGGMGDVRAWLARASRAPRDAVWMADGVAAEAWAPASPVTGKLDAFVWQRPPGRPGFSIPLHPVEDETPDEPPALTHTENETVTADAAAMAPERPVAEPPAAETIAVTPPGDGALAKPVVASEGKIPPKPVIFPQPELPDDPGEPETPESAATRPPYPFGRLNNRRR